jgi:hypothetical protein
MDRHSQAEVQAPHEIEPEIPACDFSLKTVINCEKICF